MNCYNHNDKTAVGICKHCNKALCHDCITEINGSISCKGQCEEKVAQLNGLIDRNIKIFLSSKMIGIKNNLFPLILGIILTLFGFFNEKGPMVFSIVAGVIFIIYSIRGIAISFKYSYKEQK